MVFDQEAWHKRWRAGELDQIDRELRRVADSFALVVTFLASHDEGGAALAEATELGERTKALRAACKTLGEG